MSADRISSASAQSLAAANLRCSTHGPHTAAVLRFSTQHRPRREVAPLGCDELEDDGVDHGNHAERSQSQAPPEARCTAVWAVAGASRQVAATVTTARHPRGSCAGSHVRHATRRFGSCLLGRHSRAHRCLRSLGWPSPPSPSGGERGLEKDRLPAPSARRVPPLH